MKKINLSSLIIATAALFSINSYAQENTEILKPLKSEKEVWMVIHATSHHMKSTNLNENNLGLGIEYKLYPDAYLSAGAYKNSYSKTSAYLGVLYQPLALGDFHFGALAGTINGYPSRNDGKFDLMLSPVVTYRGTKYMLEMPIIITKKQTTLGLSVGFKF